MNRIWIDSRQFKNIQRAICDNAANYCNDLSVIGYLDFNGLLHQDDITKDYYVLSDDLQRVSDVFSGVLIRNV